MSLIHKTYILVGLTGSGKSTTANSIINKSGKLVKLQTPFETYDGSTGCTLHFQVNMTSNETVLDTVGFGDPQFTSNEILDKLKKGLEKINNKVTHVILVVRCGRFNNEIVEFLSSIQEKILKNKCRYNSVLLVTDAPNGWVQKQNNPFIQKAIDNCNGLFYEYSLRFDRHDDDEYDKKRNILRRQETVDSFLNFLNSLCFNEINLSVIKIAMCKDQHAFLKELEKLKENMSAAIKTSDKMIEDNEKLIIKTKIDNYLVLLLNSLYSEKCNFKCNFCGEKITGKRYHCTQCYDYDLCFNCKFAGVHKKTGHHLKKYE